MFKVFKRALPVQVLNEMDVAWCHEVMAVVSRHIPEHVVEGQHPHNLEAHLVGHHPEAS